MIEKSGAMEILVASCPSFQSKWASHLAEWGNDVLYSAAGDFASHLLDVYRANGETSFPKIAVAIERLMTEGVPWVREFAAVGVLEGVQNCWLNHGEDPEIFGAHLLPKGRQSWEALNAFWLGSEKK
ncbi:MAG: hypothetical protein E6Q78_11755 [Rhodoferax sp.]|nr:MAG: hypothetical protein E6Q78_11755 [Rhodoferax sp.]